jgi:hypothetical protein
MLLRISIRRKLRRRANSGRFFAPSVLFLFLFLSARPTLAHTYYVSSSHGADRSAGTKHAPWKTIARVNAQPQGSMRNRSNLVTSLPSGAATIGTKLFGLDLQGKEGSLSSSMPTARGKVLR